MSDPNQLTKADHTLPEHKGWYSRGYLPHYDSSDVYQAITYRLADGLPQHVVKAMYDDPETMDNPQKREEIESLMDKGYGACYLGDPRIGRIVENNLLHFNGQRYQLMAWVVMPNHVHVLIKVNDVYPIADVVQAWKSYTAKMANKILGRSGPFWYRSYYDRYIRNERHYAHQVNYIHQNPVRAGLVGEAEDWLFSSARLHR